MLIVADLWLRAQTYEEMRVSADLASINSMKKVLCVCVCVCLCLCVCPRVLLSVCCWGGFGMLLTFLCTEPALADPHAPVHRPCGYADTATFHHADSSAYMLSVADDWRRDVSALLTHASLRLMLMALLLHGAASSSQALPLAKTQGAI